MMMILCAFVVSIVLQYSVAEASNASEHNYQYHQVAACCNQVGNSNNLANCLQKVNYNSKDIAIISYASTDILEYAAYAFGVNAAYAEENGYELVLLDDESGSNYEPRDTRWNHVKILANVLDPLNGRLNTVDYVVWMDADLIVLDMDFDIRKIIAENSESDIIISSERHAETGVANTGCFIMKNSAWSRDFLHNWWENYDRSEAHDQIFFDKLYKSMLPGIEEHVTILPQDAMNSSPPPMLYQTDDNQVLHMMGQPDVLRQEVFMTGFDEMCQAYTEKRVLASQFGLSKKSLSIHSVNFYLTEIGEHVLVLNSSSFDLEQFYNSASICLLDLRELLDLKMNIGAEVVMFNGLINDRIEILTTTNPDDLHSIVAVYNLAVPFAELLFEVLEEPYVKLEMLKRIEMYLNVMLPLLHESAKYIVNNQLVKHYTTKGDYMISLHKCSAAEGAYEFASSIYKSMGDDADELLFPALQTGHASVKNCIESVDDIAQDNMEKLGEVAIGSKQLKKKKKKKKHVLQEEM